MRAKRSLGQNFLTSRKIASKIAAAADLSGGDTVVEIGPGKGILTEALLLKSGKVVAIEKDDKLFEFLSERFEREIETKTLELIHGDALEFDNFPPKYKLVANIPYNITGEIFRSFLSRENQPEIAILMLQKEVAERITARDGKESILSNSIKVYGDPKMALKVSASFFKPKPKVDSAVLKIKNISKKVFERTERSDPSVGVFEEKFFEVLRAGFRHKRKIISNNLKIYKNHKEALQKCSVSPRERAENLSINEWICLARKINTKKNVNIKKGLIPS